MTSTSFFLLQSIQMSCNLQITFESSSNSSATKYLYYTLRNAASLKVNTLYMSHLLTANDANNVKCVRDKSENVSV